jgi:hypothetical protein
MLVILLVFLIVFFRDLLVVRNKAVSDGAISFYVDCYVSSCISRYTFGVYLHDLYDPNNPEHIKWIQMKIVYPDHEERIPGLFSVILPRVSQARKSDIISSLVHLPSFLKNTQVDELTEFHLTVSQSHQSKAHFENIFSTISCYLGDNVSSTMWKDVESSEHNLQVLFLSICTPPLPLQNYTGISVILKPNFQCALNSVPKERGKRGNTFFG